MYGGPRPPVAASGRFSPQHVRGLKIIESTHPVAASGCFSRVAASGRFCRVAASGRFLSSGRKWLLFPSGRKWPLLSSGREWPQVAAFVEWPQVAAFASGREWPQVAAFSFFNFHPQCNRCDIAVLELLDTGINSFSCFVLFCFVVLLIQTEIGSKPLFSDLMKSIKERERWMINGKTDCTETGQEIRQKENLPSGLNLDDLPRNGCHIPATHKTLQKFFSEKSFEERL